MNKYFFKIFALTFCSIFFAVSLQAQREVIIDADTGNEMDDLYAIVMAILSEDMEVIGLSSAHFNNAQLLTDSLWHIYPTKNINTLEISQQLNEELLQALGREDIPHPKGASQMLGYAWGYYEGAPIPASPASDFIIEQAKLATEGEKLAILCLGAVTNVATALELAPEIADKISVHLLGMQYNVEEGIWNKNEFNVRNDLNAMDQLLTNEALELHVMPASTSSTLKFSHQKSLEKLARMEHPVNKILARRWAEVSAGAQWTMWDLALVEAMIYPTTAELEERLAPAENGGRPVQTYVSIKPKKMEAYFWEILENKLK
ncbi:purine nucleosidase [Catalinimonas alkaloidigena]|uniref:nucleoside hydrolase n=1 Tax=Catalinimonas alkaloidigena TaxID=1075417 RepID=UPI002406C8CC|nr:nucleoside hydrolase [Catalinimonas alkaloidigena]MDF9796596.1 purine nucleosidase [Catalinimonas alkaloidigena]